MKFTKGIVWAVLLLCVASSCADENPPRVATEHDLEGPRTFLRTFFTSASTTATEKYGYPIAFSILPDVFCGTLGFTDFLEEDFAEGFDFSEPDGCVTDVSSAYFTETRAEGYWKGSTSTGSLALYPLWSRFKSFPNGHISSAELNTLLTYSATLDAPGTLEIDGVVKTSTQCSEEIFEIETIEVLNFAFGQEEADLNCFPVSGHLIDSQSREYIFKGTELELRFPESTKILPSTISCVDPRILLSNLCPQHTIRTKLDP